VYLPRRPKIPGMQRAAGDAQAAGYPCTPDCAAFLKRMPNENTPGFPILPFQLRLRPPGHTYTRSQEVYGILHAVHTTRRPCRSW